MNEVFSKFSINYLTKIYIFCILAEPREVRWGVYALVAQLAEHIHGKDKVISSILIEGYDYPERITRRKSAALHLSDRGL